MYLPIKYIFNNIVNKNSIIFIRKKYSIWLCKNLIPTQFDSIIAVPKDMKNQTMNLIHEIHTKIMFEYLRIECTDFFTDCVTVQNPHSSTVNDSKRFIDFLIFLPNGVHRMSPQFPGTVQSSDSISLLFFDQGNLEKFLPISTQSF